MNKLSLFLCFALFAISTTAQVKMPQPSPTQTIKQNFGIGEIELTYSRPGAKGRKIFGDLVPFDKIWRTGANAATKFSLTEPIEMGGKKLDTGSYVLYTIPGKQNWEIIINKGLSNWGIDGYKESEDVARFTVEPKKIKPAVETFTMEFANVKAESCELLITWEKTAVTIPITTNFKEKVKAQLEAAMLTDKKPYWQAAQFYNEYEKDLPKAIGYADKALETYPKAFWIYIYKARMQKENGDIAGAKISSDKSLELAKEAKNDDYIKMNEEFQKKL
ncbi:DUF2911 domain-containing protein [Ferruginibacter lapsinanis]|uniref:DUF2911 domain-containing protein n=1 Tax=Ferruginibacter lapsinanis TaxID=563172 RepID=UPI001E3DDD68|nr:DUF2911 domain-containing protein [Ferruginibacter lapsinanis]UEG48622.1 DUF2911 domain-containing protein [Ferruginibacter lapsinanis]